MTPDDIRTATDDTRHWLERAVIGLNLCPFAKGVHTKQQVRYAVCTSDDPAVLLEDLRRELLHLAEADPEQLDTTLLIAPHCLPDFLDFNDFLNVADALLEELGLEGDYQVADFHPQYQFGGTDVDDMGNFSNRAPYPTLHLLREDSIDRAVEAFPEAEAIFEQNIARLEQIGPSGWQALDVGAHVAPLKDYSR